MCCWLRYARGDPLYDANDCYRDTFTDRYLCVCDHAERTDEPRGCCDFRRASGDRFGASVFGFQGDTATMSGAQKRQYSAEIFVRRLLFAQALVFMVMGVALLLFPREVAFSLLVSNEYMQQAGFVSDPEERVAELQREKELKEEREQGIALKALHGALSQLFGDKETTNAEKHAAEQAVRETLLDQVRKQASESPPLLVVSSFTRMYGSACIGFAMFSVMLRNSDIRVQNNSAFSNMMWYIAMLGGLVMSAVDRAGGTESTTFMIVSIGYCAAMAFAWCAARERLSHCIISMDRQRTIEAVRKGENAESSDDEDTRAVSLL